MSKDKRAEREQEGNTAPQAAPAVDSGHVEKLLESKLAPLDEARQRTDSWMKEITSQVARLASESEGDERRAGSVDKRIADLESRIQSLLTLTEVASLDKNPFADRGSGSTPAPVPTPTGPSTPAPAPQPAPQPAAEPAPGSEAKAEAPGTSAAEPASDAAVPAPQEDERQTPPNPATVPAPAPAPVPAPASAEMGPAPEPPQPAAEPDDDARIRHALSPDRRRQLAAAFQDAPAAADPRPSGSHPNDAFAEPDHNPFVDPAREPEPAAAGVHGAHPEIAHPGPSTPGGRANETRRRLMILQWAELLSHELPRLDLGSFLGFYVETGWVDRALAACVRNLAWQLHQASGDGPVDATHTLPELHARSILMLSHLSDQPVPRADAKRIVEDAREAIDGAPILATHPA